MYRTIVNGDILILIKQYWFIWFELKAISSNEFVFTLRLSFFFFPLLVVGTARCVLPRACGYYIWLILFTSEYRLSRNLSGVMSWPYGYVLHRDLVGKWKEHGAIKCFQSEFYRSCHIFLFLSFVYFFIVRFGLLFRCHTVIMIENDSVFTCNVRAVSSVINAHACVYIDSQFNVLQQY